MSINPRPCHSEPVTDVTGVGIRNLLAGNLRKSAGIMRFRNGLPRQSADWLAMTGFFDRLNARPERGGHSVCQRTCTVAHIGGRRAGPMCPAAQGDTDPPCLPLRGRWQREALSEGKIPHGLLSPSRLRRRDVVPQGHLFRCAPRQDAVPYAQCAGAPACPFVGGDAHIAPPESMHILRRDTWVPPYRVHVSGRTGSMNPPGRKYRREG